MADSATPHRRLRLRRDHRLLGLRPPTRHPRGAVGEDLIVADVDDVGLDDHEVVEDHKPYREWCVPAAVLNELDWSQALHDTEREDSPGPTPYSSSAMRRRMFASMITASAATPASVRVGVGRCLTFCANSMALRHRPRRASLSPPGSVCWM